MSVIVICLCATAVPVRAGAVGPALAFHTDTGSEVVDLAGSPLSSYQDFEFFSLDDNVFAGSRHNGGGKSEHITAYDATTGNKLFRIDDAFAPVVVADGRKIAFWPDRWANRDPYGTSVWVRNRRGRERRVFQLTGPRATVPRDPFEGDGVPLSMAFDSAGRTLAVAFGNDVDLFVYDVWVVDVKTKEATRVTRGMGSHWPSLSPSGAKLALLREADTCGTEFPRPIWDIQVMSSDGADKTTLLEGTCDLFYADPRWISETGFVAARLTKVAEDDYIVDLVEVDATTGTTSDLVTDVSYFTTSAALQQVAFHRSTDLEGGFHVYDLMTGEITDHPEGYIPHLSGEHRLI